MLFEVTKAVMGTLCLLAVWISVEACRNRHGNGSAIAGDQAGCIVCLGCTHTNDCSRQKPVSDRDILEPAPEPSATLRGRG
jgi:hypothetical protein